MTPPEKNTNNGISGILVQVSCIFLASLVCILGQMPNTVTVFDLTITSRTNFESCDRENMKMSLNGNLYACVSLGFCITLPVPECVCMLSEILVRVYTTIQPFYILASRMPTDMPCKSLINLK